MIHYKFLGQRIHRIWINRVQMITGIIKNECKILLINILVSILRGEHQRKPTLWSIIYDSWYVEWLAWSHVFKFYTVDMTLVFAKTTHNHNWFQGWLIRAINGLFYLHPQIYGNKLEWSDWNHFDFNFNSCVPTFRVIRISQYSLTWVKLPNAIMINQKSSRLSIWMAQEKC
jgi:hypothetical protein